MVAPGRRAAGTGDTLCRRFNGEMCRVELQHVAIALGVAIVGVWIAVASFRGAQRSRYESAALPLIHETRRHVEDALSVTVTINTSFEGSSDIAADRLPMPLDAYPTAAPRPSRAGTRPKSPRKRTYRRRRRR